MKNLLRLLIAVIFGAVAAGLNWMWMTRERDYPTYMSAGEPIRAGEAIAVAKLTPVPVKGDEASLGKTLVPWGERWNWVDRPASRDYSAGDPFLQRDLTEAHETTAWDTLGPFTLIGVGSEPTVALGAQRGQVIPTSGNILTLAVKPDQVAEKDLLYRYLSAMRQKFYFNESPEERRLLEIIAVEPELSKVSASGGEGTDANAEGLPAAGATPQTPVEQASLLKEHVGDRLMFVSLEDIPNAPAFLRIGERIHFVVPPGKERLKGESRSQNSEARISNAKP